MNSVPPSPVRARLKNLFKGSLGLAVMLLVIGWFVYTPPDLLGKADSLGYAVCHRIDLRSFQLNMRQLPLCARCTGMYLGAVIGLVFQSIGGQRRGGNPPWKVIAVLGFFVVAFGVDGVNSFLALILQRGLLYEPNNTLRLFTGTGMGLAIAAAIYPAFTDTVWADATTEPALGGFKPLGALVGISVLINLLILSENWVVLYAAGLISAAGVLLLLAIIYSLVVVLLLRRERVYNRFTQFGWPALAGFGIALAQIFASDILRYSITHTWGGFPLG